ncbi:hypothetical protein O9G_001511 [Rozella allomycis CSF55]|uniref:Uncharacterized protein n=1 Tax=Rozella allomycis (strain CSF55) TaxID=988480 RepID=A0A075AR61_ROZAC|nr:hypothetical protein O9G_001511 [Rozella allomycis CSF55]|eukprot:EPZ31037.1 hypothetical protein O9G_001511 [Rozella allomycis CSF55]
MEKIKIECKILEEPFKAEIEVKGKEDLRSSLLKSQHLINQYLTICMEKIGESKEQKETDSSNEDDVE